MSAGEKRKANASEPTNFPVQTEHEADRLKKQRLQSASSSHSKRVHARERPSSPLAQSRIVMNETSAGAASAIVNTSAVATTVMETIRAGAEEEGDMEMGSGHVLPALSLDSEYATCAPRASNSLDAHHVALLEQQLQASSSPSLASTSARSPPASSHSLIDWKAMLSCGASPSRSRKASRTTSRSSSAAHGGVSLSLLQQCASSWSLEPSMRALVAEFNATGKEHALIEFTQRRSEFLAHIVAYLNNFWAVITGLSKTMLAERVHQAPNGHGKASMDFVMRSKSNFRGVHENKLVSVWTFHESRGVIALASVSVAELWLKAPARRSCATVVFDPRSGPHSTARSSTRSSTSSASSNFNLWRGFRIPRELAERAGEDMNNQELSTAIRPFLDHIRSVLCKGDADAYIYCLQWMASLVQYPWRKLGVALVLQGEPGSGKGIIVTRFLGKIVGQHHFSHVTGLDQICGQFNAPALATACLVFADEAMCARNKQYSARLKTLITEPTHTIESKYAPALSVLSFANYILASNEEHVVDIEHKDRRYFALQTDNRYSGSQTAERKAYFDRLLAVPVLLVACYLYRLDLSHFQPRQIPTTSLQRAQKALTFKQEDAETWLLGRIEEGTLPAGSLEVGMLARFGFDSAAVTGREWEAVRSKAGVYEHYVAQAGARPKSAEIFWRRLQEIISCRTIQKRAPASSWESSSSRSVQMVQFPSLDACKQAFRVHVADPKWVFAGEAEGEGQMGGAEG